MVLPAGLLRTLNNIWQQLLVDLGGPFSPQQNRGWRFLILPHGNEDWLSVARTYKIRLPGNIPVAMFSSLTLYDNETRSMIQNTLNHTLVGSLQGAKPDKDGSFDVYFGPEQADFDKKWVLGNPEKIKLANQIT